MQQRSVQSCHGDKQIRDCVRKSQALVAFAELSCFTQPSSSSCSASSSHHHRCFFPGLPGGCLMWHVGDRAGIPMTLPSAVPMDKKNPFKKKKSEIFFFLCVFMWLLELELRYIRHTLTSSVQGYSFEAVKVEKKITWQENTVALNLQPLNLGKLGTCGGKGMHLGSLKWPEFWCFLSRCLWIMCCLWLEPWQREEWDYFLMVNTGLNAWVHTVGLLTQLGRVKAAASPVLCASEAATGRPQPHWPACWCVFPAIWSSVGMQELQGQHGTLWLAFPGASCAYGWTVLVVTPLTVTNALFGSEMQHYGSLGRCNGNLGGFISCPPPQRGLIQFFTAHSSKGHAMNAPQGCGEMEPFNMGTGCSFSSVRFAFACFCYCPWCACRKNLLRLFWKSIWYRASCWLDLQLGRMQ